MIGKLKTHNYLVVTIFIKKLQAQQYLPGSANVSHRWLKIEQLRPKPNYILDESTNKLLQTIQSGREFTLCPCDVIKREDVSRIKGVATKRQESQPMDPKRATKEKSIEQQVLELAGYGENGELVCVCV